MAKRMGPFSNIGKSAKDLLNKDFSFEKKFTLSTTTASGIALQSIGSKKGDAFHSEVKADFSVAKNLKAEVKVNTKSEVHGRFIVEEVAPGLKIIISGTQPYTSHGKAEIQYSQENFNVTGTVGLNGQPLIEGSAAAGYNSVSAGGEFVYDTNTSTPTKFTLGIGVVKDDFTAAFLLADKGNTLKASYIHSLSPDAAVAAELAHKFANSDITFTVGAQYRLDRLTHTKVRVNNRGSIAGLIQHEFRPKSLIVLTGEVDSKNFEKNAKFGVHLNLKP